MIPEGVRVIWAPQPGGQEAFLSCPIYECLAEGNRGGGKTEVLLMDFAQFIGRGYGESWRGILFRQSFPQLADITSKAQRLFKRIFPKARYNESKNEYVFPTGEVLYFRYIEKFKDYWNYHGHEYPWVAFEELIAWASSDCYDAMKACCRSSHKDIPRHYRATTNPFGPGHNWIKSYFIDPISPGQVISNDEGELRTRVRMLLQENKVLMDADPGYVRKLKSIKEPMKRRAWLLGDWDIVSGGALDDVWNRDVHIIRPFKIPLNWFVDRSFDWGSSKPFSTGWWAESNGEIVTLHDGNKIAFPKGTVFRIAEWYGWVKNQPNEGCKMLAKTVGRTIADIEKKFAFKVYPGPADPSIFTKVNGMSIAKDMAAVGVRWYPADNSPGSRKQGLEKMRQLFDASLKFPMMEDPGLFIFDTCKNFIRTVPTLVRDDKIPDDVDSAQEDHIYDETRYRIYTKKKRSGTQGTSGT